jgi:DNA-binding NtrC family response regulator
VSASALRILVVDDNRSAADALARVLRKQGDEVDAVYDGLAAIERIRATPPDVVLTDLKMEPVDGLDVLQAAREMRPPVEVIVFTAYGAVDVAVKAMHLGARDFLTKPVTVGQVAARLEDLRVRTEDEPIEGEEEPDAVTEVPFLFIAESDASRGMVQELRRAAIAPSPVWIEGEIGSGREHAARAIHEMGSPGDPFTVVNVGRRSGWPESGTVLIQNIDHLALDQQRDLARDLESLPPRLRVITTAGVNGRRLVTEGRLASELYYALAVLVIEVPPLRERAEDVVPLLEHALDYFAEKYDRPRPALVPEQIRRLTRHTWPGNVRELFNLAERAVVMGSSALDGDIIEASPAGLPKLEPGFNLSNYLESVERQIIVEALRRAGGDRNLAGRLLNVERNTLRYKLNKYGLLDK